MFQPVAEWGQPTMNCLRLADYSVERRDSAGILCSMFWTLGSRCIPHAAVTLYVDVDGDGWIKPLDILKLVNYINDRKAADAEGEGEASGRGNPQIIVSSDVEKSQALRDVDHLFAIGGRELGPAQSMPESNDSSFFDALTMPWPDEAEVDDLVTMLAKAMPG